jgi:hypothetical protein
MFEIVGSHGRTTSFTIISVNNLRKKAKREVINQTSTPWPLNSSTPTRTGSDGSTCTCTTLPRKFIITVIGFVDSLGSWLDAQASPASIDMHCISLIERNQWARLQPLSNRRIENRRKFEEDATADRSTVASTRTRGDENEVSHHDFFSSL